MKENITTVTARVNRSPSDSLRLYFRQKDQFDEKKDFFVFVRTVKSDGFFWKEMVIEKRCAVQTVISRIMNLAKKEKTVTESSTVFIEFDEQSRVCLRDFPPSAPIQQVGIQVCYLLIG